MDTTEISNARKSVFISCYHEDDWYYVRLFQLLFGHLFICKYVKTGEIETDQSTEYIERLIELGYIGNKSVIVVLVGRRTWGRKMIDWEISAGLSENHDGNSGLLGLLLPTFQLTEEGKYSYDAVPRRLAANVKSGYAKLYRWQDVRKNEAVALKVIGDALQRKAAKHRRIRNEEPLLEDNLC